ncbi:hypothetical protein KUV73_18215 [Mameliella alba]|nr:hypothetical protein [Mameliella alba]MBY6176315.1 hypothetical protein [Mameliella alba]
MQRGKDTAKARTLKPSRKLRFDAGISGKIEPLDREGPGIGPKDHPVLGHEHFDRAPITHDHGNLAAASKNLSQMIGNKVRTAAEKRPVKARDETETVDVVDLAPAAIPLDEMFTGTKQCVKAAVHKDKQTLVLGKRDTFSPGEGLE